MAVLYPAVQVSGGLLPGGVLQRIGEGDPDVPGIDPVSYDLAASESVRRLANAKYLYLRETYADFTKRRDRGVGSIARLTRDEWLGPLLRQLDYRDYEPLSGGIPVDDRSFPVSHRWQQAVPLHLLPWHAELDKRVGRAAGPAGAAPHAMVQQLLNQSDRHLWAVLSNGQRLRLLRDSTSLVGSSYVEFDLQSIFEGELFADFVLLFRMAHATRLKPQDEEVGPPSCLLEQWRAYAAKQGERALTRLRGGVEAALEVLGTGFLDHPANQNLRERVGGELSLADFKRSLLRLIYRLLFWLVVEDRDLLLAPDADKATHRRYHEYLSSRRLRKLAVVRRHSRHGDLWQSVKLVFRILGSETGSPTVGLPGIGGIFEHTVLDEPLCGAELTNAALLQAVEALSVLAKRHGGRHMVDFRHLGAEELGSVYEALLELHPYWDATRRRFHFQRLGGNDRKKSGSYYTPASLIDSLLDSVLEPLLDEACAKPTPAEREAALLAITVCDPAVGSGHFLVAAARRIAKRLAAERTDELEPRAEEVRTALRAVVSRCCYGADINEMSAELAKLSLWLEAYEPGKPLGYLDANIRVGNSLLGATPAMLAGGLPDAAFAALDGDDRKVVNALRKQNAAERRGQRPLGDAAGVHIDLAEAARATAHLAPCESLADVHVQAKRAELLDEDRKRARLLADAWCAAFVGPKTEQTRAYALTHGMLERLADGEQSDAVEAAREIVRTMARQYRFFHWHIEFPHIFHREGGRVDPATGWTGGFSCVLTNPPWERVKLQEQEFFAARHPGIAEAPNAAARKQAITALKVSEYATERELFQQWQLAQREVGGVSHLLRVGGRYPLTGRGDINTYSVFAETSRLLIAPDGLVGAILPTGIATDATTQAFFKDLVTSKSLLSLYDFENEAKIFETVHHSFRFALLSMTGRHREVPEATLAFRTRFVPDVAARTFRLTPEEITLLNPNTGTCPVFLSRRDAEITLGIYRRVPVLWAEETNANPWELSFLRMFDMATDSASFRVAEELFEAGWHLDGNVFVRGAERMLPLYEAKMIHHFDHRLGTYEGATQAQLNVGTLPRLDEDAHRHPGRLVMPRYWVAEQEVQARLGQRWSPGWQLGWRDICRSTDERTLISAAVPRSATGDTLLLAMPAVKSAGVHANLATFVLDFVARQKVSGTHLKYHVLKQLPVLPPERYRRPVPWDPGAPDLAAWVTARVLELSYTAHDLTPYARDLGDQGPPFVWDPRRRELIRVELDAAYFQLYGTTRDEVDHILDSFTVLRQREERTYGEYRMKRLILERYDAMTEAVLMGRSCLPVLSPQPGHGPRHGVRSDEAW
ncbi:restriction endonuclease [Micromonospora craterilacus]|uniref:site-specific DNA-methyltransferase (adenine-specific) n=1 Tax=Micromonospora craterilacus TaxID=1655439 RepID=A0A2W2FLW3_9ACTN|nr:DNA methyltransferase [Micromonospora craterilacus]PZG16114.1 restriction endonuclease [Micromonospora craterilacus]